MRKLLLATVFTATTFAAQAQLIPSPAQGGQTVAQGASQWLGVEPSALQGILQAGRGAVGLAGAASQGVGGLSAGAAAAGQLGAGAGSAVSSLPGGGYPVIDISNMLGNLQNLAQWAIQIKAMASQLLALNNGTNVSGVLSSAGGLLYQRIPGPGDTRAAMNGTGGFAGLGQQMLQEDRLYAPAEQDEWAKEMERQEIVTANAKAIAEDASWEAQLVIEDLPTLKAEIEAAESVTDKMAIAGAIQTLQLKMQASQKRLEQIPILLAADNRVIGQRAQQRWRRDVDLYHEKTAPALAGW